MFFSIFASSYFIFNIDPGEVLELMRRFVSLQRFRKFVKGKQISKDNLTDHLVSAEKIGKKIIFVFIF